MKKLRWFLKGYLKIHLEILIIFLILASINLISAKEDTREKGFAAGPGRMSLGLNILGGLDTNLTYMPAGSEIQDINFKISPNLMYYQDSRSFNLETRAEVTINRYVQQTSQSSIDGKIMLNGVFNPKGKVKITLTDNFRRTTEPQTHNIAGKYEQSINDLILKLTLKPGGGTLKIEPAAGWSLDYFDYDPRYSFNDFDGFLVISWNFLPKTTIYLNNRLILRRWKEKSFSIGADQSSGTGSNVDSNNLYIIMGIKGAISPKIALDLSAGYGDTLIYENGQYSSKDGGNFRSAIGTFGLIFTLTPMTKISLGADRGFEPIAVYRFYQYVRGKLSIVQGISDFMNITLGGNFGVYDYGALDVSTNYTDITTNRSDQIADLNLKISVEVTKWIDAFLTYNFKANFSNDTGVDGRPVSYTRHEILGGIDVHY